MVFGLRFVVKSEADDARILMRAIIEAEIRRALIATFRVGFRAAHVAFEIAREEDIAIPRAYSRKCATGQVRAFAISFRHDLIISSHISGVSITRRHARFMRVADILAMTFRLQTRVLAIFDEFAS